MPKYLQGKYRPLHPEKYQGDVANIIYRSSWEMSMMVRLDKDPNVVLWSSEETIIQYISPLDGDYHRYFPDFQYKTKDGKIFLLEIKPDAQTKAPILPKSKKLTKTYKRDIEIWAVNNAKWSAAREFCEDRNWEFKLLTERELGFGNLNTKRSFRSRGKS